MAVKNMRNFKQFLNEDIREYPDFQISYNFGVKNVDGDYFPGDGDDAPGKVFENVFRHDLNLEYERDDIDVQFNDEDEITVYIPIRNQTEANKEDLQDHMYRCKKVLTSITGDNSCNHTDRYISIREAIPTGLKLEWDTISFYLPHSKITSLSGIHKQMITEDLLFSYANKISSSVLGIMIIPKINRIIALNGPSANWVWFSFIQKGLRNDLDLIEVKEQMMEQGLKEYAKL